MVDVWSTSLSIYLNGITCFRWHNNIPGKFNKWIHLLQWRRRFDIVLTSCWHRADVVLTSRWRLAVVQAMSMWHTVPSLRLSQGCFLKLPEFGSSLTTTKKHRTLHKTVDELNFCCFLRALTTITVWFLLTSRWPAEPKRALTCHDKRLTGPGSQFWQLGVDVTVVVLLAVNPYT